MIVRVIAGRDSSFLVPTTLEDAEKVGCKKVACAEIEGKLPPGLDEIDPKVIRREVLQPRYFILEDFIVVDRRVLLGHLLVGHHTEQLLEVDSNDILQDVRVNDHDDKGRHVPGGQRDGLSLSLPAALALPTIGAGPGAQE